MATLLVSAAVNIGVGLLLNFLFPSKGNDVVQEGPRLNDLDVTSSAYGQSIPIHYGTIRTGGNVIWATPIEEVENTETESAGGKGGGGGSVTTKTYSYFASFAVGLCEGVAEGIIRIWADGKLIYDRSDTSLTLGDLIFRFYPGDEEQLPDALIEADKGVGNVPAHRGLCYLVFERLPLANFGNRIPNITVEVTFHAETEIPYWAFTEFSGVSVPGSASGADSESNFVLDPKSDKMFYFKSSSHIVNASISSRSLLEQDDRPNGMLVGARGACLGTNGKLYAQFGSGNGEPFYRFHPDTLEEELHFGVTTVFDSWGTGFSFTNGCHIGTLEVVNPGLPPQYLLVIVQHETGIGSEGGVDYYQDHGDTIRHIAFDDSVADLDGGGVVIQDPHNRLCFFTQNNSSVERLYRVTAEIGYDILTGGEAIVNPSQELVATLTKSGVDFAGTGGTSAWCVLPLERALILSNGSSMVKVDIDTGTVLARNLSLGFGSRHQWSTTGLFAFANSATDNGAITIISTDTLQALRSVALEDVGFIDGRECAFGRGAYDPRSHSYTFSRLQGSPGVSQERIVRVFLDRLTGEGVPLDEVVADLCERAGLESDEYDVNDLAGEIVEGYSVTRQSPVREAIEPLMKGFLFEGVESDFKIKYIMRGHDPAMLVDGDNYMGLLTGDKDDSVKEVRIQEVELPERFSITYADRETDYQQGVQADKRVSLPLPTQSARNEIRLDLPLVSTGTKMKQLAQKWLYTSWAERVQIESVWPWRYLVLDPTDIFSMVYRGEVLRMRLSQMELGANYAVNMVATKENGRSHVSDVVASDALGFIPQTVPSLFPSKLFLLDLPLLGSGDNPGQSFSRAYWAAAGYEEGWPGALLYRSRDDWTNNESLGSSSGEVAWGTVSGTVPDATTTTTWEESVTLTVKVNRGVDRFVTATESQVLAGANALAVLRAGGPEIIQFTTVTVVQGNTIQLSGLLRGRLGTEDNAVGHAAGETVVLLESGRIYTFQNELDLIGLSAQYRGVTAGTRLEEAASQTFTYTGQDLVPYSVAQISATRDGIGGLVLNWQRRTRFNGALRDGTGTVPLNEQAEEYEVEFYEVGESTPFSTKTVTTNSASLVSAEIPGTPPSTAPEMDVLIYQMSEIVGRGRATRTRV